MTHKVTLIYFFVAKNIFRKNPIQDKEKPHRQKTWTDKAKFTTWSTQVIKFIAITNLWK